MFTFYSILCLFILCVPFWDRVTPPWLKFHSICKNIKMKNTTQTLKKNVIAKSDDFFKSFVQN